MLKAIINSNALTIYIMTLKKLKLIGITLFLTLLSFTATNTFAQPQPASAGTEFDVAFERNSIKATPLTKNDTLQLTLRLTANAGNFREVRFYGLQYGSLYGNIPKTAFDGSGSIFSALTWLDLGTRPESGEGIGQSRSENAPLGDGLAMLVGFCIIFGIRKINNIKRISKK